MGTRLPSLRMYSFQREHNFRRSQVPVTLAHLAGRIRVGHLTPIHHSIMQILTGVTYYFKECIIRFYNRAVGTCQKHTNNIGFDQTTEPGFTFL